MTDARITREEAESMFRNMLNSTGEYKNDGAGAFHFGRCEFYKIMDAIYGPKMTKKQAHDIILKAWPSHTAPTEETLQAMEVLRP